MIARSALPGISAALGLLGIAIVLSFPTGGITLGLLAIAAAVPSLRAHERVSRLAWVGLVLGATAVVLVPAVLLVVSVGS